jgi:hypothetical protein
MTSDFSRADDLIVKNRTQAAFKGEKKPSEKEASRSMSVMAILRQLHSFFSTIRPRIARILTSIRMEETTMKNAHALTALTLVNLGMLVFFLTHQAAPVKASGREQVVRARALEIVDDQGKLRASLSVIPEGPSRRADGTPIDPNGRVYPEAVVFRLIRPDGRPSVKIATTEQGSGIDLSGGIDPTYLVLSADGGDTSLTLTNKDGRHQVIKP